MSNFLQPVVRLFNRPKESKETQETPESLNFEDTKAPRVTRVPSPEEKNEVILANLRKVLEQDRKVLTRNPILKHLVARYDAIVNQVTIFGHPKAPVEPTEMFKDRVNELTVEVVNKQHIRNKKQRSRRDAKISEKSNKHKGQKRFDQTYGKSRNARS